MNTTDYIVVYLLALLIFFAIDLTWLGIIAKDFYSKALKNKIRKQPNWTVAIVFYCLFVLGLSYFAIWPAVREESLLTAMFSGALFGFFTYVTYDLTNLATLKSWPKKIVVADIAWGTLLAFSVSTITYNLYIGFIA